MLELMLAGFVFDIAARSEVSVLKLVPPGPRTCCSKQPREVGLAEPLLAMDPDQWFIYLLRDPRDVVVSIHNTKPDCYWANLALWRRFERQAAVVRGHPRFVEVRYEELVRNPDAVQEVLAALMPFLPRRGTFSSFHERAKPSPQSQRAMRELRPVDDRSIGTWRQHKPRIVGQITIHGTPSPELIALGYETDASWEGELEGIAPDLRPGRWPEHVDPAWLRQMNDELTVAVKQYAAARKLDLSLSKTTDWF
jgi:hypothetical protein